MKEALYVLILMIVVIGCKKPYNPPAITAHGKYLVVEGVINSGPDFTIIKLSSTVNVSTTVAANAILNARVIVEGDNNNNYALTEGNAGYYYFAGLNLDQSRKYRLRIVTPDNRQYLSDFVAVKITPPIDSVGFAIQSNGIQLYVNAHDGTNNTRYYRWDYNETWQFHSKYSSSWISNGTAIVSRTAAQQIDNCFSDDNSSTIVLGSSAKLKEDIIYQNPITTIASTSEKIEIKYSMLLRQYALTNDAYNFWVNTKKNTEQLGSIFDAQPSNINGNIHNINNPSEPVIGYMSVCTVQSKRIFITNAQLPQTWLPDYPYTCGQDTNYYSTPKSGFNAVAANLIPLPNTYLPTSAFYKGGPTPSGFLGSSLECVDCTIRGYTAKPSFWK